MFLKKKMAALLCILAVTGLSLSACGNSSSKNSSSKDKSTKVVKHKHHKKNKKRSAKNASAKKQAASSSAASSSNQQPQGQQNNNGQQQGSSANGQLPPANNLSDFVNRYGVSPALWKMQHGMSAKDALLSTPENMRSSGENQDVTGIQQGYIDPNTLQSK